MDKEAKSTALVIRTLRAHYGESQQAFSHRLGISIGALAHYETCNRLPDYRVCVAFEAAARKAKQTEAAAFFQSRMRRLLEDFKNGAHLGKRKTEARS
jgi:transcriptional regulator with XRE-family HTH domain